MQKLLCELGHICPASAAAKRSLLWAAALIGAALFVDEAVVLAATLQEAEARQVEAEKAGAALLSPSGYLRGTQSLEKARASEDPERRSRETEAAAAAFDESLATVEVAKKLFAGTLLRRTKASEAGALRAATDDWTRAEKRLNEAVRALERDKPEKAQARSEEASEFYRSAEVTALKARYLGTARNAILEAEESKAEKLAPRSLAMARAKLDEATAALEADPPQTDEAATLAQTSSYQAQLALAIAQQVQQVRDKETSIEDLVLANQARLGRIAGTAGTTADFSSGAEPVEAELRAELERLKAMESELNQSRRQVLGLEEEVRELDRKLGNTSAERRNLMLVVQANLRAREQFEQVQSLFSPAEAEVLREGDKVTLRMVGLRFPSGSAQLDGQARGLIDRLDTAIDIYPRSQVRVEGHTDSSGSPGANQALSQKRATAVAAYLLERTGMQEFRVKASGYGDSRPVTSNRTAEGRARNRRIDVVIITKPTDNF